MTYGQSVGQSCWCYTSIRLFLSYGIEILSNPSPPTTTPTQWMLLTLHWGTMRKPWALVPQSELCIPGSEAGLGGLQCLGCHQPAFSLQLILPSIPGARRDVSAHLSQCVNHCSLRQPQSPDCLPGSHGRWSHPSCPSS